MDCTRGSLYPGYKVSTVPTRLCLINVAGRVTEMVTRIKIAVPTLPGGLHHACRQHRQDAAVNKRGSPPQNNLSGETANPDHPRHWRNFGCALAPRGTECLTVRNANAA